MTEPTQAAKQRACDLANAHRKDNYAPDHEKQDVGAYNEPSLTALAQLCQDISDAVEVSRPRPDRFQGYSFARLDPFILPEEPDVLAEALRDIHHLTLARSLDAKALRAALAKRGHEVAPIGGKG